jgi:ABC-type nitrate/sulfonate/bicarbonate transport system substrate-binding protein
VLVEISTDALDAVGLRVDQIPATTSPAQFQALLDGELDAIVTSLDNVLAYHCVAGNPLGHTVDVRILAALDRGLGLTLYSRSGSPEPGNVLGVDVPESGFAFVAYELLDRLGLPRADYTVEALGSTPRRTDALLSGQCDLTVLNAGNELRAEAAGALRLASVTEIGPYVGSVLATRGETIQQDGGMLSSLIGALLKTSHDLVTGKNIEAATEAARRRLGLDQDAAGRHVRMLVDPAEGLIADGWMSHDALSTVVELRNRHLPAATQLSLRTVLSSGIVDDGLLPTS